MVEVYFDDFKVTHIKSPVIQSDDYYPFGGRFNSYSRESSLFNKKLYNGKEIQDDLSLDVYDYGARFYDPWGRLGFWQIDPLAEKMRRWSPYGYAFDNPIRFIDRDGMAPEDPNDPKKDAVKKEPPKTPGLLDKILKSIPKISLETSVTIGPQAGIKVGKVLEADLSVASVELVNDKTTLNKGSIESTKKLGTKEVSSSQDGVKSGGVKVTNEASISVLGFGGGIGQSQNIDGNLRSKDYKSFDKVTSSVDKFGSTVTSETDRAGNTTTKQETGFTLGLKFIIGVELKFQVEQ